MRKFLSAVFLSAVLASSASAAVSVGFKGLGLPGAYTLKAQSYGEFPFTVWSDDVELSSSDYEIERLTVTPESNKPAVAEFSYVESTRTLRLIAKTNGTAELGVTYRARGYIPSIDYMASSGQSLSTYYITVNSTGQNDSGSKGNTGSSGGGSSGGCYSLSLGLILLFMASKFLLSRRDS